MTPTARHHDADVCLLAQSLRTAIGRLASFRKKTLRDRDRVQTRELVGRYGRRGQADAFIWSGRAKARYARIACSSG